ncbi:MAG: co-chaperone GroES [Legionellales bacterium]|nr:co-chaperone GroES [Legionellales bacterium]|tara:strand:+ start:3865 stop:4146 length:282 start_codon:yes stop_codon:yes gene_type:complete
MSIKPLNDRVLVKKADPETKTSGGIIVTDPKESQLGEVAFCGPGKIGDDGKHQPMEVKPGDKVIYAQYSGSEVTISGEKFLVMRADDIVGIVG